MVPHRIRTPTVIYVIKYKSLEGIVFTIFYLIFWNITMAMFTNDKITLKRGMGYIKKKFLSNVIFNDTLTKH